MIFVFHYLFDHIHIRIYIYVFDLLINEINRKTVFQTSYNAALKGQVKHCRTKPQAIKGLVSVFPLSSIFL